MASKETKWLHMEWKTSNGQTGEGKGLIFHEEATAIGIKVSRVTEKCSIFNLKSLVLLYNLGKCQIAFSKVYFNIQYPPRMSNSCAGCDL